VAQPDFTRPLEPLLSAEPATLSADQAARESALREVGETLLNIETAIRRADRARREIGRTGTEPNFVLALDAAIAALEETRRTLHQETYFGSAQHRLV
jgi:hypothetical protein